jgi:hypothetical protein
MNNFFSKNTEFSKIRLLNFLRDSKSDTLHEYTIFRNSQPKYRISDNSLNKFRRKQFYMNTHEYNFEKIFSFAGICEFFENLENFEIYS